MTVMWMKRFCLIFAIWNSLFWQEENDEDNEGSLTDDEGFEGLSEEDFKSEDEVLFIQFLKLFTF